MGLFDLSTPVNGRPNQSFVMIFHITLSVLVIIVLSMLGSLLSSTLVTPSPPIGWSNIDYDANQNTRDSLINYMAANNLPIDSTPMNQFAVATANWGGIFTEEIGLLKPWIGTVSPEAARLQVEAGARAITLDIWPDPADRQKPVVIGMLDTQAWSMQNTWMKWGLDKGVGRYSNWQQLTRNKVPVGEILKTTLTTAFNGFQSTDPFFLILKLHGAMTVDYLNTLGNTVHAAIAGNAMGTEWNKCMNQAAICTTPVSSFISKVFVIVIPDIQPGYNLLPNINTYAAFTPVFLTTRLGEITNALEQIPNTIFFEPSGMSTISAATQPPCGTSTSNASLAQAGFCVIQPSIGGQTTDNSVLYSGQNTYTACIQSGAQFVAVNYFSKNSSDGPLTTVFDPKYFGKYSFRKN